MVCSKEFCSNQNIEYLNKKLISILYQRTGEVIQEQDPRDMLIVLQWVYRRDNHHKATIEYLNNCFLKEILPNLEQSFELHLKYLNNLNALNAVQEQPLFISNRRSLVNKRILKK